MNKGAHYYLRIRNIKLDRILFSHVFYAPNSEYAEYYAKKLAESSYDLSDNAIVVLLCRFIEEKIFIKGEFVKV